MKPTKITKTETEQEIDWSVPQWVIDFSGEIIILTTGTFTKSYFEGMCLPCENYPKGCFSDGWGKKHFKPLTEPLTIIIEN